MSNTRIVFPLSGGAIRSVDVATSSSHINRTPEGTINGTFVTTRELDAGANEILGVRAIVSADSNAQAVSDLVNGYPEVHQISPGTSMLIPTNKAKRLDVVGISAADNLLGNVINYTNSSLSTSDLLTWEWIDDDLDGILVTCSPAFSSSQKMLVTVKGAKL